MIKKLLISDNINFRSDTYNWFFDKNEKKLYFCPSKWPHSSMDTCLPPACR
jgi:hypothetical protein